MTHNTEMAKPDHIRDIDGVMCMQNSQGAWIPVENIKTLDKLKDESVRDKIARAQKMQDDLRKFKTDLMSEMVNFQDLAHQEYAAKMGSDSGALTLRSFDGNLKVQVSVNKTLQLDEERAQVAKSLVDECLKDWTSDSRPELRKVIDSAFKTDSEGRYNLKNLLALMNLEIDDERWNRAMQALGDGLHVDGKKLFLRFYERGKNGEWQSILLDLAKV